MESIKKSILTDEDADDFNKALSLVYIGSLIEDADACCDNAVHLRNLCDVALNKLCNIRNRINKDGIEVKA